MSETGADGGSPGGGEETAGDVYEERTWRVRTERVRVTGGELWSKLRQLVREGNVRRIIIRGSDERLLIDIPVTAGVVGVVLAPFAVAIGGVAALALHCTIEIERVEEAPVGEATTEQGEAERGAEAATERGEAAAGAEAGGGVETEVETGKKSKD